MFSLFTAFTADVSSPAVRSSASRQGLTLVHFPPQLKRILWDRGSIRGYAGGVQEVSEGIKEYRGVFRGCILCQKRLRLS